MFSTKTNRSSQMIRTQKRSGLRPLCRLGAPLLALTAAAVLVAPVLLAQTPDSPPPPAYRFVTLAGVPPVIGDIDGPLATAGFKSPSGLARDRAGNLFVVDRLSHVIRKISSAGVVTTLATLPYTADATRAAARSDFANGLALDSAGNLYVADAITHTIRQITPDGIVTTFAGLADQAGSEDGTGPAARFNEPQGVAVDARGNVYVTDHGNHTVRKITPAGEVSTLAGLAGNIGNTDGPGTTARFRIPGGLAIDRAGNLYVSSNCTIRKITPDGTVTTLAGKAGDYGNTDGPGPEARFGMPAGLAVDGDGNVFATDTYTQTVRRVAPDGTVTTLAGLYKASGNADGTGAAARFSNPEGLALDDAGNLYVADTRGHTIRRITPAGVVTTIAGPSGSYGYADGPGTVARFNRPTDAAVDGAGNVYVVESLNHTVRRITPAGLVSTVAGRAGYTGSGDGPGAEARFFRPNGVGVDPQGNVLVSDMDNRVIRRITPDGIVSVLAGQKGRAGHVNGASSAARFDNPQGAAVDGAGNIYVAENVRSTIRKITPEGLVSTLAGSARNPGSEDGSGSAARFRSPQAVAVDDCGNVYVADAGNHTIRRIAPDGVVTTLGGQAGNPGSADGVGASARFNAPGGVAIDRAGRLYVIDSGNNTIRVGVPVEKETAN